MKTKSIWLIVGFILTLVLAYKLAISKTIAIRQEFNSLKNTSVLLEDTPRQMQILKQKQVYFDSILSKYRLNKGSIQNNLLQTINTYADSTDLKVINFIEPHTVPSNDLIINTYQFTLEGSYNSIIKLIYILEQETKFGEIINLHFEKKTNFKTSKQYLQAQILLKSYG
ncbi:hypothetical protein NO995_07390 [Aestuariibaculum sp. M13]|uniref:hypothetical protein n=1 Tax=Aestuariibaculum sp. M13 TaxID=2967132 RepID=UPI002159EECA|nr:hypothetical protein [Aestuariibaculum sp. M13]MCR8667498.1 hypothetical protein [Aestuariibaculum sp. M13]